MNLVLDTNIVVYLQKGLLAKSMPAGTYFLSAITEIELFSFPGLTANHESALRDLLQDVSVVGIDAAVSREAIRLRRDHRLRVPDAIVAGTAIALNAQLLTNDQRLLSVPGLNSRAMPLRSPSPKP